MSLPLELEQSASISPQVKEIMEVNTQTVGATPEMAKFYTEQPLGILANTRGSKRLWKGVVADMKRFPHLTTIFRITAESGGIGKSLRAQKAIRTVMFDPEFIEEFIAETGGWIPEARYLARTTVGQDLQHEYDNFGDQIVDVTAPNWRPHHITRITNRLERVVAIAGTDYFQQMNRKKDLDKKVATLLVVEDIAAHSGRIIYPVTRHQHGLWVVSNPLGQDMASEQRKGNEDPSVVLGDIYKNNGNIAMDNPGFRGPDAEDYMGNDGSRRRAHEKMGENYLTAKDVVEYARKRGIRPMSAYNLHDLEDLEFRNEILRVFFVMRAEELGFSRSRAAVVDNVIEEHEFYNLQLMRGAKVNSTQVMRFIA